MKFPTFIKQDKRDVKNKKRVNRNRKITRRLQYVGKPNIGAGTRDVPRGTSNKLRWGTRRRPDDLAPVAIDRLGSTRGGVLIR